MVANSTGQSRSQQTTLNNESAQNDISRPKIAQNIYPKTEDAGAAKSEKRAASRARGVAMERVVAPESKGVIGVKVRSPASVQVAGFPKGIPSGKVVGVGEAKKRTKQETKKMTKSRRGYKWISHVGSKAI
jgi:hypothetical protein